MLNLDLTSLFEDAVGVQNGLNRGEWTRAFSEFGSIPGEVQAERVAGTWHHYLELPHDNEAQQEIRSFVKEHPARTVVILGIGGSTLGSTLLTRALPKTGAADIRVIDNVDPDFVGSMLDTIDFQDAIINVVTKSGATPESIALAMLFFNQLEKNIGDQWKDHVVITTGDNPLRQWALERGISLLSVPEPVGGRFSVLSSVGLLCAEYVGIDTDALLQGACEVDESLREASPEDNGAWQFALAMHQLCTLYGKSQLVMMPYANRLLPFVDWFRQLWSESLGKKAEIGGRWEYFGQTPIKALGTTDQHSQIQLYTEGPPDKVLTFFRVEQFDHEYPLASTALEGLVAADYLRGRSLTELLHAEQQGTALALTQAGRPHCTFTCDRVNERTIGALILFFELATSYSAKLYEINAYDQPGVENGKIAAFALLNREGYEDRAIELKALANRAVSHKISILS